MKRLREVLVALMLILPSLAWAQKVTLDPTITPSLFQQGTSITVVYDVTGTSLAGLTNAYAWVWIPGANIDAKYNINPASNNATATNNAKFAKSTAGGKTLFTLTFIPSDFFATSIATQTKMGILLKGNDWGNGQTTDYIADFWDGSFTVNLISPTAQPLFVDNGDSFEIKAETPAAADYDLYIDDVLTDEEDGIATYTYQHTVTQTSGVVQVRIVATTGANTEETSFEYIISGASPSIERPAGIIPGINYVGDATKVTLCLWAPGKTSVYARGDFNDWKVSPDYLMNRDGELFWIEISGLTSGTEYAFQYLVDETVYMADPYADKVLDPDDIYIPASSYPSLKPFPTKALSNDWYYNRVAVFQTGQTPFAWQATDYTAPAKEELVIYELLIRDFFGSTQRTYANLTDTLGYLKRLGVNAIELMPVMEFNGNDSWGYNPTFMFAPDKYYGPKNRLKEFIDECHKNDIAVIFDIALNHQDIPNPYVLMDFDFANFKPAATNKWFNPDAKHPFNVFYDMNHESAYTKAYVDTIAHYWLHEYKVDGFRFDLSKGFTQTNNPSNVDAWSAYDASRIALLKRMADKIWSHSSDAIIILEHFAANTEEKELAEYRAGEGKGMLLWGNHNYNYNQNTMGYVDGSNFSGIYFKNRSWSVPHLVGYMESHDEERLMYRNIQFGNSAGSYSTKNLNTALGRVAAASLLFYTVPGPKMLWQFGELGYDVSIDENGRVGAKPVKWEYYTHSARRTLHNVTADLIRLRTTYSVFTDGEATLTSGNNLVRQITLKNSPYTDVPAGTNQMNVQAVANFDVTQQNVSITFPHTGTWYDYYDHGASVTVTVVPFTLSMAPGTYKLYTDVPVESQLITGVSSEERRHPVIVYPNPVVDVLTIEADAPVQDVKLIDVFGRALPAAVRLSETEWDVSELNSGVFVIEIKFLGGSSRLKVVKE